MLEVVIFHNFSDITIEMKNYFSLRIVDVGSKALKGLYYGNGLWKMEWFLERSTLDNVKREISAV